MRLLVLGFVLALQVSIATFAGGCGSTESPPESLPACSDVDWLGRGDHAQLTGEPTFSALEIAPGEPLRIAVPVDANTRSVSVSIGAVDLPGVGTGGKAETIGGEIVDIPVDNTTLPAGVYVAVSIPLEGERSGQSAFYGSDRVVEAAYRLTIVGLDVSKIRCATELTAPSFTVVSDGSDKP